LCCLVALPFSAGFLHSCCQSWVITAEHGPTSFFCLKFSFSPRSSVPSTWSPFCCDLFSSSGESSAPDLVYMCSPVWTEIHFPGLALVFNFCHSGLAALIMFILLHSSSVDAGLCPLALGAGLCTILFSPVAMPLSDLLSLGVSMDCTTTSVACSDLHMCRRLGPTADLRSIQLPGSQFSYCH
jgi:hypothetical protein